MATGFWILIALAVIWLVYQKRPVKGIRSIPASELPEYLKNKGQRLFIDVREPHEFNSGHVEGMKNVPLGQIGQRINELSKDREIVLMCRSGNRSMMAARTLKKRGYDKLVNVQGGITSWKGKVVN